jgi:hypothetical protein
MRSKDARCRITSMHGRLREEGGVLSDTLWEMSSSEITLKKITRVYISSYPTSRKRREKWGTQFPPRFPELLADAELSNDRLIALGIVSFEVVE